MERQVYKNKGALIKATISATDSVLDIGFLGQGIDSRSSKWPHALLLGRSMDVSGVDLSIDRTRFPNTERYHEESAEEFSFPGKTFDVVFAGDVIEHFTNPGRFLSAASTHMNEQSRLIITTPNCFNVFNIAEKFSKDEPTVNADHTCYFNRKTLAQLLSKCGFRVVHVGYVYSLEYDYEESWKKKVLNVLYRLVSYATPKYLETLVVIAMREPS